MESYIERFEAVIDGMRRKQGHRFKEQMDRLQLGVTRPQFFMLHLIHEQGKCNVSTLADLMEVKPSAITVMLDRLVHAGYVNRRHDDKDRRVVFVELTASGTEALVKVGRIRSEIVQEYLSRLQPEELDTFVSLFEKITRER